MKFGRVIADLVQMNRRRFIISLYRYIPLAGEFRAHVSLDLVQRFFRWRFVEAHRDAVLVDVQPHLLHVRMRFNQPDYSRPGAGGSVRALLISNNFVGHDRLWAKERRESQRRLRFALHFLLTRRGNPVPSPRWREAVF